MIRAMLTAVLAAGSCVILVGPAHAATAGLWSGLDTSSDPVTMTVRDQSSGWPTGKRNGAVILADVYLHNPRGFRRSADLS